MRVPRRRRLFRSLLVLASYCLLAFVIAVATRSVPARAQQVAPSTPKALASSAGSAGAAARARAPGPKAPEDPSHEPQKVSVGIYVHHINQVDLRANTFLADFYVWFRWKGDHDPSRSFELRNAVEQWQIVKVPINTDAEGNAAPVTLEDGTKYQVFRIEARFGRPFSVGYYPLDEQDLLIEVEESDVSTQQLVYEIDSASSGVDGRIVIPGWEVATSKMTGDAALFATNFGDPRMRASELYARATMGVHILRPTRGMIVKTIVPLAIVILITFGVFLLDPTLIDARLTLSVTALVSAIALHFSTSTELPEVGYLVLLDKVYILSYAVILATTAASIVAARIAEGNAPKAKRFDKLSGVLCWLMFFGGTFLILYWR